MQSCGFTSLSIATIALASISGIASAERSLTVVPAGAPLADAFATAQPFGGTATLTTGVSGGLDLHDQATDDPGRFDAFILTEAEKEASLFGPGPARTLEDYILNHPFFFGSQSGDLPLQVGSGIVGGSFLGGGGGSSVDATGIDSAPVVSGVPAPGAATVLTLGALLGARRRRTA